MPTEEGDRIKAYCNACANSTNHYVVNRCEEYEVFTFENGIVLFPDESSVLEHAYKKDDLDDRTEGDVMREFVVVQCDGCDRKHFIIIEHEWNGCSFVEINWQSYPPRYSRPLPKWLAQIEDSLRALLEETYSALHDESYCLATMGIRAALERLMILQGGDQGSFAKNIDKFIDEGYLQPRLKKAFMEALEAGHAAIHRGFRPEPSVLSDVFDILEGIIVGTLILPTKAENVQKVTPIRRVITNTKKDH